MIKLFLVLEEYHKFIAWGYSSSESVDRAIKEVFKGSMSYPYVVRDIEEFPSHIFYEDGVLFFNEGAVYKKITVPRGT